MYIAKWFRVSLACLFVSMLVPLSYTYFITERSYAQKLKDVFYDKDGNYNTSEIEPVVYAMLRHQIEQDYAASHPPIYTNYFTPEEAMSYVNIVFHQEENDNGPSMRVNLDHNDPSSCCKMTHDEIKTALSPHMTIHITPCVLDYPGTAVWSINHELAHVRQNMNKLTVMIQRIEQYRDAYQAGQIDEIGYPDACDPNTMHAVIINDAVNLWVRDAMLEIGYLKDLCHIYDDDTLTMRDLFQDQDPEQCDMQTYRSGTDNAVAHYLNSPEQSLLEIDAECEALRHAPCEDARTYVDFIYDECPLWARIDMLTDGYIGYSMFVYDALLT